MTMLAIGLGAGLVAGFLGERLRERLSRPLRRRRRVPVIDPYLARDEPDDINRHYAKLRERRDVLDQQLSGFASELAGDDVLLRGRLRRFERGAAS